MNIFNQIQLTRPKRSLFDLSYDHKLSLKMGKLVPVHLQECVPGDKFTISSEGMFRMMPMIAPIMHKVDVFIHHFFVPNRIIWPGWQDFITGGTGFAPPPAFPIMDTNVMNVTPSSLANYLGIPVGDYTGIDDPNDFPISALPFVAYQRIWQEYYRDQNLEYVGQPVFEAENGVQGAVSTLNLLSVLRDRAWEHDYFTSCLPFAQKGDAVELPLDITGDIRIEKTPNGNGWTMWNAETDQMEQTGDPIYNSTLGQVINQQGDPVYFDPEGSLGGDFDNVSTTTTINDLRTAFSLQKWLEKNARAGSRYIESILAHFGVRSSDKRLQRPEYLGGSRASMAISEVLQTSSTDATTPQGNMSGHGISVTGGNTFKYYCEEHGYIMGILSIRPKTAYFQGLPRHFSKRDRLEYYWPDFAFLGEQSVKKKELYVNLASLESNDDTFGYIPRYSEYRYNPSRVSGEMANTLEYWHMARKFANMPSLNAEFIKCNPTKRIFAVEDEDQDEIVAHIFHKIMASRPMPKYGNPGSI